MILLDTNIISELMSADPSKSVIAWFAAHEGQDFFISSVSVAEISYGLHILPQGKRRESLEVIFKKAVIEFFRYRVL
ncbi:MAG: PIN domain-containing protein, partial [Proteobacteria bacterium]|nr:PIN domain-containing protein [Pseudomonadota bacterium]